MINKTKIILENNSKQGMKAEKIRTCSNISDVASKIARTFEFACFFSVERRLSSFYLSVLTAIFQVYLG